MTALAAFEASTSGSQSPFLADASSQSSYASAKSPIFPPASSIAIRMPLTMVVVCALALPVRGRLETILITPPAGSAAGRAGEAPSFRPHPPHPRVRSIVAAAMRSVIGSLLGARILL